MSLAAVLVHHELEGHGKIYPLLAGMGYGVGIHDAREGIPDLGSSELIVGMGGPMSVNDNHMISLARFFTGVVCGVAKNDEPA